MGWWKPDRKLESPEERLTAMVTQLLHRQRFLGEIILQLPREFDDQFQGTVGLSWSGDQLLLKVNPDRLAKMRNDEAGLLLEHEALHIVWRHPVRYASHPQPDLVKIATDVAVNQYLPAAPAGTVTLAELTRLLRRRLPEHLDSAEYLALLKRATPEEQDRLQKNGLRLAGKKKGARASRGSDQQSVDSHAGWKNTGGVGQFRQQARLDKLGRLLKQAWQHTPQRDRGLLPGAVRQELQKSPVQTTTPLWSRVLRQQLGRLANGKRDSSARFNRRQPLRMDLPGQVARLRPDVRVFVDNSGSVPDAELIAALDSITRLAMVYQLSVRVRSFDARVSDEEVKVQPGSRLPHERRGGGGTSFQCIFDFLRDQHVPRRSVVVIITDGWGEKQVRDHHYRYVYWLLTSKREQLSVDARADHVFELRREKNNE